MIGKFELLIPGRQIRELFLLGEIERDPSISQSKMALKAGIVPSMVNTYIKQLSQKGFVDKKGTSRRKTTYYLTDGGRNRFEELMKRYSIETVRLYKYAKGEFRKRLQENLGVRGGLKIALFGAAETGEIVYQVCVELGHRVVAVVDSDPTRQGQIMMGTRVLAPNELSGVNLDVVVITSLGHADEIMETLEPFRARGKKILSFG